jgi:diguanylate cyclase (GGDEF)-like protein/PAS domain S-box-containing protein/excisionase family DNA binding protein
VAHSAAGRNINVVAEDIARLLESGGRSQEVVLQEVTRTVAEHFGAGALLLFLAPGRQSVLTAGVDHPDPVVRAKLWQHTDTTDLDQSPVMQQMVEGRTVRLEADSAEQLAERVRPSMRRRVLDADIRSALSVPLQSRGVTYGALCLYHHGAERPFTAADEERLRVLCARIAPLIDHDRVLRALIEEPARARARQVMVEATERFRTVFEHVSIGMALFSIEDGGPGRLIEVNPRLCEIIGVSADELLGRRTGSFDHPENLGAGAEEVQQLLAGALPAVRFEKRLVRADGREIIAYEEITVVRLPDGSTPYGIALLADVTEQRRVEADLVRSEALTRGILDAALDAIVTIDRAGVVVEANPAAERVLGWTRDELVGRPLAETAVPPEARAAHTAALQRLADAANGAAHVARRLEVEALRADGTRFAAELSITSIGGQPPLYTGHLRDITDRLRASEQLARRVAQQGAIAALERRALQGASLTELMETAVEAVAVHLPADEAAVLELRDGVLVGLALTAAAPWPLEALTAELAGPLPADLVAHPRAMALPDAWRGAGVRAATVAGIGLRDEEEVAVLAALDTGDREHDVHDLGFLQAMASVLASASQRRAVERELRHRALHDQLTGLPNRTLFRDRLDQAAERAARAGSMVAVLLLDVDRFKNVNDAVGHLAGDELLRGVARRLAGAARPGDTIARFGGDEFAVLAEDVDGEREAIVIAEALLAALDEPLTVHDRPVVAQLSVGVAVAAEPAAVAPDSLIRDAGVALARAKEGGGGRFELFEPGMRKRLLHRVNLEEELRRALERDELTLAFQPVVDLTTARIASLEALLRWDHPQSGVVLPGEFLDVAETSGLAVAIGRHVLTSVCRQVARWCADPDLLVPAVSVNVSARELAEPGFVDEVAAVLRRSGVPAGKIALEVKETELLDEGAGPTSTLQRLRELGVSVVLDDFGTGWSSLADLKRFPITGLKIDRALIGGLADGKEERHIVRAVTGLADALQLFVVAEGVETPAVAQAAVELGCTLAQGFLFGRPVPAPAIDAMLRAGVELSTVPAAVAEAARHGPAPAVAPAAPSSAGPDAADATMALSDAAEALGVSASTLRRWADSGRLRVVRTSGGHRRFAAQDVRRLSRETAGREGPVLRPARLPEGPIPELAALVAEEGPDLLQRAGSLLYEPGGEGWFAAEPGARHLETWLGALRAAAAGGVAWDSVIDATRELATRAGYGGAAQVEGHLLLERMDDLVQFRLRERRAPHDALVQARRLLRALHRAVVDAGPGA